MNSKVPSDLEGDYHKLLSAWTVSKFDCTIQNG